jgi:cyanophycinase
MKPIFVLATLALLGACSSLHETPAPATSPKPVPQEAAKGIVVAVGGGGTTPEIIERALALAGGKSAAMLVVPQASSDPKSGEESAVFWKEHGATNVEILDLADAAAATKAIEKAAFIWMPGGDQSRLCDALNAAHLVPVIVERFRAGAVVGGTSAGAAILSKLMIIGGEKADLKNVRAGGTETTAGLGLLTDVVLDQHFVKRQRFTRLLSCVLDHPETVGVGIDEQTAVVVSGHSLEVLGESSVLIIDARGAKSSPLQGGELQAATGLKLHVLKRGDKFDLGPPRN